MNPTPHLQCFYAMLLSFQTLVDIVQVVLPFLRQKGGIHLLRMITFFTCNLTFKIGLLLISEPPSYSSLFLRQCIVL